MITAVLIAYGLTMTGWGLYWRAQAEDLVDENFTLRFGAPPVTGAEGQFAAATSAVSTLAPVAVTPRADGGMDDLLLEVLTPTPRLPEQRRPGGAS